MIIIMMIHDTVEEAVEQTEVEYVDMQDNANED